MPVARRSNPITDGLTRRIGPVTDEPTMSNPRAAQPRRVVNDMPTSDSGSAGSWLRFGDLELQPRVRGLSRGSM